MRVLADELEKMDTYFSTKKESDKWLMIVGVAGIIAFLAYTYLLPYAERLHKSSEAKKNRLTKSIAAENTYLNSITVDGDRSYYIKKYDKDIQSKKVRIVSLDKKIHYIGTKLQELEGMLFNEKSWSLFLNSLTADAEEYNINIEHIINRHVERRGNYGRVLDLELGYRAQYKDVLLFMHELEQNRLVTDIQSINLSNDRSGGIYADINLSVWGINH